MTLMIEGLKAIAEYLTTKTGFTYTAGAIGKLMERKHHPLPAEKFDGRIGVRVADLHCWIASRKGISRVRTR